MMKWVLVLLGMIAGVLAHPAYVLLVFFLSDEAGGRKAVSTNVTVPIYPVHVLLLMVGLFFLRYFLLYLVNCLAPASIPHQELFRKFCRHHLWCLWYLPVGAAFLFGAVEGNIAGFIYFPLTLVAMGILAPLIASLNMRLIKSAGLKRLLVIPGVIAMIWGVRLLAPVYRHYLEKRGFF